VCGDSNCRFDGDYEKDEKIIFLRIRFFGSIFFVSYERDPLSLPSGRQRRRSIPLTPYHFFHPFFRSFFANLLSGYRIVGDARAAGAKPLAESPRASTIKNDDRSHSFFTLVPPGNSGIAVLRYEDPVMRTLTLPVTAGHIAASHPHKPSLLFPASRWKSARSRHAGS
jgi:hypothetical protein